MTFRPFSARTFPTKRGSDRLRKWREKKRKIAGAMASLRGEAARMEAAQGGKGQLAGWL